MKICQKNNCDLPAILRGKYCEIHRTNKKIKKNEEYTEIDIRAIKEKESNIINDRQLKLQQDDEYRICVEQDKKKIEEQEYQKILDLSIQDYYNDLKTRIEKDKIEEYYSIKIKFSNGSNIIRKFNFSASINDIIEVIELYLYEMKIKISNYNIVLNYPKRVFTYIDKNILLKTLNLEKNFSIYISDTDK